MHAFTCIIYTRNETRQAKRAQRGLGEKKGGRVCRLCSMKAASGMMIWSGQIAERWQVNDEYWMNISVIPRKIPTCARILLKPMHPFLKNIMSGHITLITCYWHMCNRINASRVMGGIKHSLQVSRFFYPPGNAHPGHDFLFRPAPLWSLFTG